MAESVILTGDGQNVLLAPAAHCGQALREAARFLGAVLRGKGYVLPVSAATRLAEAGARFGLRYTVYESAAESVRNVLGVLRDVGNLNLPKGLTPYPFQLAGVAYLHSNPAALLCDEMGLGKTVQALLALQTDRPALVVCPAGLKGVWATECARWRPDLSARILTALEAPKEGELCIINYARLPSAEGICQVRDGTTLICDEAHKLKNGKSLRTMRSRVLAKRIRKGGGRVWLLTGTPLQNHPQELWSLLVMLGVHKEYYSSFTSFARAFGGKKDGFGWTWHAAKVTKEARAVLNSVSMRRERCAVLPNLPGKVYSYHAVPRPAGRELLESMDSIDFDLVDMALGGQQNYSVEEVAVLSSCRLALAEYKGRAVSDLLGSYESKGLPLVVFSAHRKPVEVIGRRDGWAVVTGSVPLKARTKIVADFQAGRLKGLAATIQSFGEGHTLTRSHNIVMIDRTYVPAQNVQAEDRVCRIGQHHVVQVIDVVCEHPLERVFYAMLKKKTDMMQATTGTILPPPSVSVRALTKLLKEMGQ